MTTKEAHDFMLRFCDRLSAESLAEETGRTRSTVQTFLRERNIKPITQAEENMLFLHEWRGKMTKDQAMRSLGVGAHRFYELLARAGINPKEFKSGPALAREEKAAENARGKKGVVGLSVREILGFYQVNAAEHYIEPVSMIEKKWLAADGNPKKD
jgi:hypothetical protein